MSSCDHHDVRPDAETLTGTRFLGKQVYVKLIDFGQLPASGEKTVAHGIANADQIGVDYARSWVDSGTGTRYGLDFPNTAANAFWRVKVDGDNVSMQVGKDRSTFSAMICIWFTKVCEQPGEGECVEERIQDLQDQIDALRGQSGGGGGGGGISYSYEEQWTGTYWVDGRKIYQKTVTASHAAANVTRSVPHEVANMADAVAIFGIHHHNHATIGLRFQALPEPSTTTTTKCYNQDIFFDRTNVGWHASGYTRPGTAYITIQYTCTDR